MSVNVNPEAFDDDAFPDELRPGTELLHGQYVIEKFLNSGGFGITYLAKDSLDRTVVIKECFPGSFCRRSDTIVCVRSRAHQNEFQSIVKLFVQEAKNLAKLKHPNIVGVHQIFEDNETAYMALDFVNGRDLLDILEDPNDGLTPSEIQNMTQKLLSAIEYIHKAGVLHRDISPDNILVDRRTGDPVLIDFGAAREEATRQTRLLSAMRVVKDGYSPQEFYIQGSQQSPSSDLYALAATLYHVITGDCPPDSQSRLAAVAAQKLDPFKAFPSQLAGFDPKFLKAINQAMNIFPYDRIQSATEWLKYITPEPEIVALPSARKVQPRRPVSVVAEDKDLADHSAEGSANAFVEPPVPAMVSAQSLETQPRDPGREDLAGLREKAPNRGKSSTGLLLGGMAAVIVAGAVGAYYYLPEGTFTGRPAPVAETAAPVDATAAAPPAPAATPEPAVSDESETQTVELVIPADERIAEPAAGPTPAPVAEPEPAETPVAPGPGVTAEAREMPEPAALPPIALPTPPAPDPAPGEAAPAAAVAESLPVLDLEEAGSLVASAEPEPAESAPATVASAEPVTEVAVATVSPPAPPLTEVPAMRGERVVVEEQAPQVYAKIQDAELFGQGFQPALQTDTSVPSKPEVDVATAAPLPRREGPATPEPEVVRISDLASVVSGWTLDMPFEASETNPLVIGSVRADAPDWMQPGQSIVAINGVTLETLDQIPSIIRVDVDLSAVDVVTVDALVRDFGAIEARPISLTMNAAHSVALLNGFQFTTVFRDGEWRTRVSASPATESDQLRTGDRLVAYIPTNERLDRQNALSEILERELSNGTSQFAFAVNRDGQLWVASLGYNSGVSR